ncbi:cell division protein SepF [Methanobrevibacter sp.]
MSFTDTLKRSLGFEENESGEKKDNEGFNLTEFINNFTKSNNDAQQQNNVPQNDSWSKSQQSTTDYDYFEDEDYVITPEQSFYEVILIRPKTIDDINYVVDQIIEEKNPVILDLSFLEKESPANFKLAGDKIKQMRTRYGAQALLLSRSEEKNLIILSPKKVRLVNKG